MEVPVLAIFLVCLLLLLSGLISGSEVAFFSLNLKELEITYKGSKFLKRIKKSLENPRRLLATILVANNFINIAIVLLSAYLGQFFFRNIESELFKLILEVGIITILLLLFGEILPKVFANRNALSFVKFMLPGIEVIDKYVLFWLSLPMSKIGSYFEKRLTGKKRQLSIQDVTQALELTRAKETSEEEHKIFESILNFGTIETKQIMCPRGEIFALSHDSKIKDIIANINKLSYSRIPVYKQSIDNIVGILYVKDLMPNLNDKDFNRWPALRKPYYVPESKKIDDLLIHFKKDKVHLAIVVDEYGGTSGLITLGDILEEVLGDISDETDLKSNYVQKLDKLTYLFNGKINLIDFFKAIDLQDTKTFDEVKGNAESLAGLILEMEGDFPTKGRKIKYAGHTFIVEKVNGNRIERIKVILPTR